MKAATLKTLLLTALVALTLGLNGCASTPEEGPLEPQRSERKKSPGSVMAPAQQPASDSDDMERLD